MRLGIDVSLVGMMRSGVSAYAVLGYTPELVFDFAKDAYFTDSASTTFDNAMTFTRAGNATMVDSDGVLKWAPHNLLTYSEQFDNAAWITVDASISQQDDYAILTATSDLGKMEQLVSGFDGSSRTLSIQVRSNSGGNVNGSISISGAAAQAFTADSDWQTISTTWVETSTGNYRARISIDSAGDILQIRFPHLYRSDLGDMVNNPDTGNSYVPTTSSAVYLPRRGHHVWNGSEWVNEGLLVESEARTNLVPYSEDITNAGWTNTNITVTDDGTSIIGLSASKMTFGSGGNLFYENVGAVVGDYVTLSAFVARGNLDDHGSNHRFGFYDATATAGVGYINFNYGTGVTSVHSGTVFAHDAEEVDGGWRIYMTIAHTSGNVLNAYFGAVGGDAGTGYFYLAGPQVEEGPTPSSYIPTAGSTATRAAETLTVPAANLPYSSTAMSIQMQGEMTYADTDTAAEARFFMWFADSANYMLHDLQTDGTRTGRISFVQRETNSGLDYVRSGDASYFPGINVPFNIASRHGSTFINGAVDGTEVGADLTPTALPDLSAAYLQLAYDFMGTVRKVRIWADDITDAGIVEASA